MIRLAADHNFNEYILEAVTHRSQELDLVRLREVGLGGTDDPLVLEWAAREGRVMLSHDFSTMIGYAYDRAAAGLPMPGLVVIRQSMPTGQAVEDILILAECGFEGEFEGQVRYLPL